MTINEYKDKHQLSNARLAELLGVCPATIGKYLAGYRVNNLVSKQMKSLGIEHPIATKRTAVKPKISNESRKMDDSFLKKFQLMIAKASGNTIVSKKYSVEEITKEFEKFGLKVKVREFENSHDMSGCKDTHYVVELDRGEV